MIKVSKKRKTKISQRITLMFVPSNSQKNNQAFFFTMDLLCSGLLLYMLTNILGRINITFLIPTKENWHVCQPNSSSTRRNIHLVRK